MRFKIEVDDLCLAGDERRSKVIYTRTFLLSVKELDVCKRLPTGLDSSGLCELTASSLDSDGDSQPLAQTSDSWRQNNLSQNLPKAPECASYSLGQKDGGAFQLSKSKNPYRPPHCYKVGLAKFIQVGLAKFEASSSIPKTNETASTCCNQQDKLPQKNGTAQKIENDDPGDTVPAETKKTAEFSSVVDVHVKYSDYLNSAGGSGIKRCTIISNQRSGLSLKQNKGGNFKKLAPQLLAARCGFEMEDSGKPLTPIEGCNDEHPGNVSKQQSQRASMSSPICLQGFCTAVEPHEYLKNLFTQPRSRADTPRPICLKGFPNRNDEPSQGPETICPVQRGALYFVSTGSTAKTSEFPLGHGGFSFFSSIPESNKDYLISSSIPNLDLDKDEDYDNYWAEILTILRSEQELELTPVASNKVAVDTKAHLGFPDADSMVSADYQTNMKAKPTPEGIHKHEVTSDSFRLPHESIISIEYVTNKSSNHTTADKYVDVSESEAELSLPDEDSLITLDDLIGPACSKSTSSLQTACNDTRPPETSVKKPSFIDIASSETQQKQQYSQTYPQNRYADFSSQGASRVRYLDTNMNLDLYCKSCPCMNHIYAWRTTPTGTSLNRVVQYSVTQEPTNISQQESGVLSLGVNCPGMLSPHPSLIPML